MIKAIIFDMDGVIVDSEPLWTKALEIYLNKVAKVAMPHSAFKKFHNEKLRGKNWRQVPIILKSKFHIPSTYKKIVDGCSTETIHIFNKSLKMIPDAKTLIKNLYLHHYSLALASSSPYKVINYIVRRYKLRKYFKVVISGIEVRYGKPNPAIFLKTASLLKEKPQSTLVFEDSINGIKAAFRAGTKCIAVKQPYTIYKYLKTADLVVKDLREISLKNIKNL